MDPEQAKQFLGISGSSTGTAQSAPTNAPMTAAALASTAMPTPQSQLAGSLEKMEQQFMSENTQPGVPLDIETGISPWERLTLSFRRERDNQVAKLQEKYGKESVRSSSDGGLIVRVMDPETNKPKDLLVDEKNMSAKDFIDILGVAPEIAGGIYAMRKGQVAPWMKDLKGLRGVVRDSTTMALGAESAGMAKDLPVNVLDRGELDFEKTAKERAKLAALDFGIGMAAIPVGNFMKLMQNPLAGSRGRVQFDAIEAQQYFKTKYGVDVPLSIGESTGSPFASRTEVFLEKMPGASTPFSELKGKQETALRKLQSLMMGTIPESDEAVGQRLIEELQKKMVPLEKGVESARGDLAKTAAGEVETILSGLTTPERQLYKSTVGQEIRTAVTAKRDVAKTEADTLYDAVRAIPGGTGKTFDSAELSTQARKILASVPRRGNVPMKDFAPPDVVNRLQTLVGLKGEQLSLSELQQMRRDTIEAIGTSEGVPGRGAHYLGQIADAITETIEKEVAKMPGGQLKTALDAANKHYREKVVPFNRTGITEMFKKADEAGHLSDSQIVSRIFGGERASENFKLMKETLGDTSPEFVKLKRAIADNIVESSRLPGDEIIDAASFMRTLNTLRVNNREIADEVFGNKINRLFQEAKFLDFAKGRRPLIGTAEAEVPKHANISADDLKNLLADKSPTAGKLLDLMKSESARTDAYKVKMLREIGEGKLSGELNPEEFVNRFFEGATSSQLGKVMGMIKDNPELTSDLRTKVIERLFRDAARKATPQDISQLMAGDPTRIVSGTSVFKQIENPAFRRKMESVLGKEVYGDLEQYIKLEAATEAKETSFKAAGGIAAGMQVANLVRKGPLQYLSGATKDFVVANLLTRQPLRGWLTSVPSSEPGAVYMLLTSAPFLQAVTKEFGEGTAAETFINALKQSVDRWTTEQPKENSSTRPDEIDVVAERYKQFLHSKRPSAMEPAPPK